MSSELFESILCFVARRQNPAVLNSMYAKEAYVNSQKFTQNLFQTPNFNDTSVFEISRYYHTHFNAMALTENDKFILCLIPVNLKYLQFSEKSKILSLYKLP